MLENRVETLPLSAIAQPSLLSDENRLAEHVREALKLADALKNYGVGIHLDAALILLTGNGYSPPKN